MHTYRLKNLLAGSTKALLEFWSVYKFAKRMSKHRLTRHKVAFEDAIDDMGYRFPSPWAAMGKVFGLTSKRGRRAAAKMILRSHVVHLASTPEYTVCSATAAPR
mmetsp:Transcript_5626/g.12743  ORF Transcript_5626/g.12743 Transcript_5626/m.12743 type:complete len:104 (-) Transcript_5626:663-974(-)